MLSLDLSFPSYKMGCSLRGLPATNIFQRPRELEEKHLGFAAGMSGWAVGEVGEGIKPEESFQFPDGLPRPRAP